jgi:hypothetical protein
MPPFVLFLTIMVYSQAMLAVTFNAVGAGKNFEFTSGIKERGDKGAGTGLLAITFDGVVKSAPRVISPSSKDCVISGRFTSEEIRDLRGVLKAGSLAVTPEILSERVVGATLGHQEIERALVTMAWCILAIVGFCGILFTFLGVMFPTVGGAVAGIRYFGDFDRFAAISRISAEKLDGVHRRACLLRAAPDHALDYGSLSDLAHAADEVVVSEIESWQAVFAGKHFTVPV